MKGKSIFALVLVLAGCTNLLRKSEGSLKQVFNRKNLTMVANPATDYLPGTLLYIGKENPWAIACFCEKAIPGITAKTSISKTSEFSVDLNKANDLSGNVSLSQLAKIANKYSSDVTIGVKIQNAEILKIDHASIQGAKVEESCLNHLNIKKTTEAKDKLKLITEAFRANIVVDVLFKNENTLSAEVKKNIISDVATSVSKAPVDVDGQIRWEQTSNQKSTLTGEGLIWAVKADKEAANFFLLGQ